MTYYCHYGALADQRLRVVGALLNQILAEPTFDTLRTKEQLGYIVSCSGWNLSGGKEFGVRIVVQSEKTPGYLEDRVESHLQAMKTHIEEMKPEVFEEQKGGLEKGWREAYKNLMEEAGTFVYHISTGDLDFFRGTANAFFLETLAHPVFSDQGCRPAEGYHQGRRVELVHDENPPHVQDAIQAFGAYEVAKGSATQSQRGGGQAVCGTGAGEDARC